ncbi:Probable 2-oxoglutarate-dependent dioxygenase AOP1.2 [Linum perenne]
MIIHSSSPWPLTIRTLFMVAAASPMPCGPLEMINSGERSLEFAKVLVEIDQLVMKLLSESYGVEDRYYYEEYLGATNYVLRYFKYNAPKEDETNVGLSPHIDKSMFTILHQNHVDGLQIKTKDDVWIDVQLNSPTSFIVFAGNGLTAWSNDRIPGCWHQVIMKGKETRYTIGLGSIASGTVPISQAMADESRPLMYKPFDHFGYLRFCEASRDVTPEGLLQAYAGVNLSSSVVN